MLSPQIDISKCNGCGLCVSICLKHGLVIVNNVVVVVESWVPACWATWQWNWKNGCAAGEALPTPRSTEHTSSR